MAIDETIREQALDWAVRTGDPAFDDWETFTLWLERDPAHADAYDRIAAATKEASVILAATQPANDYFVPETPRRRRWMGGILAMALVAVVSLALWRQTAPDLYTVETAPGSMQLVDLGEGTKVEIAGGSRVEFDRKDARYASLERGRALFTVRHDESAPFRLTVGEDRIVDVGTVFDVRLDDAAFSVAVSEGAVQFNPDKQNVHVAAGQILSRGNEGYRLGSVDIAQVGDWRTGRLSFDGESLGTVALELERATGLSFAVDPANADRLVTGSILIEPVRDDPASLGPMLGVGVTQQSGTWTIGTR